jgi:phosphoribosyl 1,2-cyclic phosphodiesterase
MKHSSIQAQMSDVNLLHCFIAGYPLGVASLFYCFMVSLLQCLPLMPLTITSLASGSSGNAMLIRCAAGALLLDCGLTQRAIERHLAHARLRPADLTAILLTHEHGDHAGCAGALARRHAIPIAANRPTLTALGRDLAAATLLEVPTGVPTTLGPFQICSFPISHDAAEPVGVVIATESGQIGVATDLGCWDASTADALRASDLIVLEANHDREKLRLAPYAWPIKNRIASDRGHLDNIAAGRLLATIGQDGRKRHVWLAHLSQEANSPAIAERAVRNVLAMEGVTCMQVQALPRRTTVSWASNEQGEQLQLW